VTFDYGNNIRTFAFQQGVKNAYDFPGFVPAYIRPLFAKARDRSGGGAFGGGFDIARPINLGAGMFPQDEHLNAGLSWRKNA